MKVTCPICKDVLEFEPATGAERLAMLAHLAAKHPGYSLPNRAERRAKHKHAHRRLR